MFVKLKIGKRAKTIFVLLMALIGLLPVLFIFANSFMSSSEAGARYTSAVNVYSSFGFIVNNMHYVNPTFLPDVLTVSAWRDILLNEPVYLRVLWNSIILAVPIVIGQLILSPLAAYGFENIRGRKKNGLILSYMITMILPMQALLVPNFIAANFFGIADNYFAIILPAIFAPFGAILIYQQMKGLDKSFVEAARVDGANEIYIFWKVVLPNIKPTMFALLVLTFAEVWNIVDQAVVFIRNSYQMPMSVYLSTAIEQDIGIQFALSSLFMIPALIVFISGQDYLSDGIGFISFQK